MLHAQQPFVGGRSSRAGRPAEPQRLHACTRNCTTGFIQSYNRVGAIFSPLSIAGLTISVGNTGQSLGFLGATPVTRPAVTGSRGGNAALASLLTALANLGLVTDSSSA